MRFALTPGLVFVAAVALTVASGTALAQESGGGLDAPSTPVPPPPTAPSGADYPSASGTMTTGTIPEPPTDGEVTQSGTRYPGGVRPGAERGYLRPGALPPVRAVPPTLGTKLRVLEGDFAALSSRGGNAIVDGVVSILTGGLSITLGYVFDDGSGALAPYLYLYGGAGIARGIIDLTLIPNPSDSAIEFSHMPMRNLAEVELRLQYGESELERLADRMRLARILDAALNIGVGAAVVPIYLGPQDFEVDQFGVFVIIGASISVVSGAISLFTRTEAERRWDAYELLVARLERQDAHLSTTEMQALKRMKLMALRGEGEQHFGLSALPGGGGLSLSGSF